MTHDSEDRISTLLHAIAFEPQHDISADEVLSRAGRHRTYRLALLGTAVIVAAVSVVLPLALRGNDKSGLVGHPPLAPSSPQFRGTVLGVDRSGRLVIEQPSDPRSARIVTSRLGVPDYPAIAGAGAAGWVASVGKLPPHAGHGQGGIQAATIGLDGTVHPFGPVIRDGVIYSLAVNPAGTELAMATVGRRNAIRILPLPGQSGPRRMWSLPAVQVTNMSWSPDGRQITYFAGSGTGDGIGGPPSFLDITSRSAVAPTSSPWPNRWNSRCQPDRAAWIDASGTFAAIEHCSIPAGEFVRRVSRATGKPLGLGIRLVGPQPDCSDEELYPASDTGQLLVRWCNSVYFLRGGRAYLLPGELTAAVAAWTVPGG